MAQYAISVYRLQRGDQRRAQTDKTVVVSVSARFQTLCLTYAYVPVFIADRAVFGTDEKWQAGFFIVWNSKTTVMSC